jgi:hypothetical protein
MDSPDDYSISSSVKCAHREGVLFEALDYFHFMGQRDPEHAWHKFNDECNWLTAFYFPSGSTGESGTGVSDGAEYAMAEKTDGGHRLNCVWRSVPQGARAGDWTVVRADVSSADTPDDPPVPYLHAVHAKQWRRRHGEKEGSRAPGAALVDEFVPAGLVSRLGRPQRARTWPSAAMLLGSTSLSLGIATASLERAKNSGSPDSAAVPDDGYFVVEQQFSDLELAIMDATHRLRTAVEKFDRASREGDGGTARGHLARTMRSSASVAQLVVAFAYEFVIDSVDTPVRNSMTSLATGAAPALQNSRYVGDFLELGPDLA